MTRSRQFRPWAVIGLLILLLLVAAVAGRFAIASYLGSDRFRQRISGAVSRKLKAEGIFMPLHLVDGTLYSDGFEARGSSGAFFSKLKADQVRAVFNWRALFQRTVKIEELHVQRLDVRFAARSPDRSRTSAQADRISSGGGGWTLDLRRASFADSSWHWGNDERTSGGIAGSAFTLTPDENAWLVDASQGTISQYGWPQLTIESAKLRYASASLFITESILRNQTGRLVVTGEVNFGKTADLQAQIDDFDITPLLASDWRIRLKGKMAGGVRVLAPLTDDPIHVEGKVHLIDGQLEALPVLNQIATFTRTERFRRLSLSKASCSFSRDAQITTVKDVVIESEGLMRVEGACTVVNGQIDGVFQIGVTAASLQWLPGSQARVFTVAHDGYFWTPLRIRGPVAHPSEDLTPRLIAAAAGELLQDAQGTIRDTAETLLELLPHQ